MGVGTSRYQKFWLPLEVPTLHDLAACASSPVESPNRSREFWVPEVLAPVGSPDALGLSHLARHVCRESRRLPEVPATVRSSDDM